MTSPPPPPGPMPPADALALDQRIIAEQAVADQVATLTRWLAVGLAVESITDDQWQVARLAELAGLRASLAQQAGKARALQGQTLPGVVQEAAQQASGLGRVPVGTQQVVDDISAALDRMWEAFPGLLSRFGQQIVTEATAQVRAGNLNRVQATTRAVDRLLQTGIAPARDAAGRRWTAPAYVEMRARTGILDAGRLGREAAAREYGTAYVQVSDAIRECPLCRPWEGKILSLDGDDPDGIAAGTLAAARAAGLAHPNCFPAGTLVKAPSGVRAADRRRYEGELVVVHTASGVELACTPNHPVLTPEGWVAAGSLVVGQSVLRHRGNVDSGSTANPDDEQVPTAIGDVFDALRQAREVSAVRVPAAAEHFHGDGEGSDVDVVLADRLLRIDGQAHAAQLVGKRNLLVGGVRQVALLAHRALAQVFGRADHSAHSIVSGGGQLGTLCRRHAGQAAAHGLTTADLSASVPDDGADRSLTDAVGGRDLALSLASVVTPDDVVEISKRDHADHVFNLETGNGWYLAENIVVHNCRHSWAPYFPGLSLRVKPERDPDGWKASQEQRALERELRAAKLRTLAAERLDPGGDVHRRAQGRVKGLQARLRAHTAASGQRRRYDREQVPAA